MDIFKNFFSDKSAHIIGLIVTVGIVLVIIYLVYMYMPENMDNTPSVGNAVATLPDGTPVPINVLSADNSPTGTPLPVITLPNGTTAPIVSNGTGNGNSAVMPDGIQVPVSVSGLGNFTCPKAKDLSGISGLSLEDQQITGASYVNKTGSGTVMPNDLLPKDTAAANFDKQFSSTINDLSSQQFLTPGFTTGINTVGSSLKNPNISLRPDPPIPKINVPMAQSSYEPDLYRKGLSFC